MMDEQKNIGQRNCLTIFAHIAAGVVLVPLLSKGELIHRWSFNDGTANDSVGMANGTLYGTAAIADGQLVLNSTDPITRMQTGAFGHALGADKTLVAWFTLNDPTDGATSGGPLSVENQNGQGTVFDAIVYGEQTPRQWMNGSDNWNRTPYPAGNGGALEPAASTKEIMMAIVYDSAAGNRIKLYRNGALYAQHNQGTLATYDAMAVAVIGPRVTWADGQAWGYLNGKVNDARIYDTALSAAEIAALQAEGPNPTADFSAAQLRHRWSFNDGTTNDSVGTAHGTLYGTAALANGALVLSGSSGDNRMETGPIVQALGTDKTLVTWCTLDNPSDGQQSGGPLSVASSDYNVFDAIVYGERTATQWMSGSDGWARTPENNGGAGETLATPNPIMLAIVYDSAAANRIRLFRNGVQYSEYNPVSLVAFDEFSKVLIGPRHYSAGAYRGYMNGSVDEARVYATALSGNQVAALYAQGPDGRSVWTQTAGGNWDQGANWSTLYAADGVGQTADFGTLSLAADTTVTLNESRSVGKLVFGDLAGSHDWFLSQGAGGALKLAADGGRPEIAVINRTLTLRVPLAGTNGFVKTGAGTLVLASVNQYQGPTVVAEGTLSVRPSLNGAVAFYDFDDASNLGRDSSDQNNALAASVGSPQYSADGKFGGSLYLDGGSLLRTASGLFPTGVPTGVSPYTVSAFIKADTSCAPSGGWIGYGNNDNNRCNCFRLNNSFYGIWNYWYYNDMEATLPSGAFNDGWHSVVGTWDGKEKALYIDGEKRAAQTPPAPIDVGTDDFVIGKTTADWNFTGWVDDLLIANRALSQEEVASLHAVGFQASTRLPSASDVKVAAGAALDLNGADQTVAGLSGAGAVLNGAPLTVCATLAPGDSSSTPATLAVGSDLTVSAGATLAYDYSSASSDTVTVEGALAVQGAITVQLSAVGSASPPSRITLFTCGTLSGAENLGSWNVQGAGLTNKIVHVHSDATSVSVTISPKGTMIVVR